jgi:1-acyl-sn-glycerol-3-phosphate acyltransferase
MPVAALSKHSLRAVYGCYSWLVVALIVTPTVCALALAPGLVLRRRIARAGARTIFALIGCPVRVRGAPFPTVESCIVVANHSSYLDGVILTACLPARFTFLIKHEMARTPIAGFILRRLGSAFVDRDSADDRHRIARRLLDAARRGQSLAFFPEGRFDRAVGLKRFHFGAFVAARRTCQPIVPIAIVGARRKLGSGQVLMGPGALGVHIGAAIDPAAFESTPALIAATRAAILEEIDEPDIGGERPAAVDDADGQRDLGGIGNADRFDGLEPAAIERTCD